MLNFHLNQSKDGFNLYESIHAVFIHSIFLERGQIATYGQIYTVSGHYYIMLINCYSDELCGDFIFICTKDCDFEKVDAALNKFIFRLRFYCF